MTSGYLGLLMLGLIVLTLKFVRRLLQRWRGTAPVA